MWQRTFFVTWLMAFAATAQVQIVGQPASGFEKRIQAAVDDIWLINTHEHMETEAERSEERRAGKECRSRWSP